MKNLLILLVVLVCVSQATAQAPQKFNYQGIARNAQGEAMANQSMALKIGILSAADAEVPDYEEIHQVKTNEFGLYTLEIGAGKAVTGSMASVRWETGNKYVRVAIDPQGGNNFDVIGTNQLLSVPYALYSDKAGMARKVSNTLRGGQANYLSKFDSTGSSSSEIQSVLYDNGNNVGIGTTTPLAKIHIQASANSLPGVRIQNINSTGVGRFLFYNDSTNSYGTMTKYGTAFVGQPAGLSGLYPYANLWTFGNNAVFPNDGSGRTLISSAGNVGIAYVKNGAFKLKFHADFNTGNVGIGGNFSPRAKIHMNNTDSTYINLMLSNTVTGHNATDGLNIALENKEATITNREIGSLSLGTLNLERMRITSSGNVGIGTSTPNNSAITEMSSSTQGFLPPRMTTIQRNAIISPANGLIIFNTTTGCLNYCFSGTWFEWCGNFVATGGAIGTLNCAGVSHTGTITATQVATGVSSNINYSGGNGGLHVGQTVNSTGVTGLTATLLPGNFAIGSGSLTYTINGTANSSGIASFLINIGGMTCTITRSVNAAPIYAAGTVHCNGTPTLIVDIVNPFTGKTWMDRNLGALQVANNPNDSMAFGDLYQWGRGADGHQCRNSAITFTSSSSDQPGNNNFIVVNINNGFYDWRNPTNINLWQGVNGINNPCPIGYRVPTYPEFQDESVSWLNKNSAGAFYALKIPLAGSRDGSIGSMGALQQVGSVTRYWTSNSYAGNLDEYSYGFYIDWGTASMDNSYKSSGRSIRCIKD